MVGAIVAWNVPQVLIAVKLAPALLAGCTVVIKAAPEASLDAMLLAEILDAADLPRGAVSILTGGAGRRPGLGRAPWRGQDRIHRIDCSRTRDRGPVRPGSPAMQSRVGRKVGCHPVG